HLMRFNPITMRALYRTIVAGCLQLAYLGVAWAQGTPPCRMQERGGIVDFAFKVDSMERLASQATVIADVYVQLKRPGAVTPPDPELAQLGLQRPPTVDMEALLLVANVLKGPKTLHEIDVLEPQGDAAFLEMQPGQRFIVFLADASGSERLPGWPGIGRY